MRVSVKILYLSWLHYSCYFLVHNKSKQILDFLFPIASINESNPTPVLLLNCKIDLDFQIKKKNLQKKKQKSTSNFITFFFFLLSVKIVLRKNSKFIQLRNATSGSLNNLHDNV